MIGEYSFTIAYEILIDWQNIVPNFHQKAMFPIDFSIEFAILVSTDNFYEFFIKYLKNDN